VLLIPATIMLQGIIAQPKKLRYGRRRLRIRKKPIVQPLSRAAKSEKTWYFATFSA
jgi:hypothetical protein